MMEYLPAEIRDGLQGARLRQGGRRRRLSLHQGDMVFSIRRMWTDGFSLALDDVTHLRGLVEIHEGPRHILTCLINAVEVEGDELLCSFKRASKVQDRAALDYVARDNEPVWLLTSG
ncbi:hypothetical protein [Falsigemmobacter faecalis]|uniref:PilZ domain-containing protein n=1 Tax=Falsigemmobacter faecalis TaxID=2488730 RepID=A0A3P3DUN1_9RHOB|nr:hypothetical protein [Falsigemmobacter faecalis]RRH77953.1 hypothetical protein EG244_02710 [Falsigemmobacter faecalis]